MAGSAKNTHKTIAKAHYGGWYYQVFRVKGDESFHNSIWYIVFFESLQL